VGCFDPLRFRIFAKDLERAVLKLSQESKMGGLSELRQELGGVPGIDTLQVAFGAGQQHITLNGHTVTLGVNASIDEIRKALGLEPMTETNATTATPVPQNQLAAPQTAPAAPPKPAPATGGFAAQLRAIIDEARAGVAQAQADGLAQVRQEAAKLNGAKAQIVQVTGNMAKTIADQTASVLAELGQISNMPPE
jgi:hypothetical protein